MEATELCKIIRQKRDELGLTRKDLADHLGISARQVENVEKNRHRVVKNILAIASALGIELTLTNGEPKVVKVESVKPELSLKKSENSERANDILEELKNRLFLTYQEMSNCTGISMATFFNIKTGRRDINKYAVFIILYSELPKFDPKELRQFREVTDKRERWIKFQDFVYKKTLRSLP